MVAACQDQAVERRSAHEREVVRSRGTQPRSGLGHPSSSMSGSTSHAASRSSRIAPAVTSRSPRSSIVAPDHHLSPAAGHDVAARRPDDAGSRRGTAVRSRRIWPFTGRTGGIAASGRPGTSALHDPAASTTVSVLKPRAGVDTPVTRPPATSSEASTPMISSPPARSRATESAASSERGSTAPSPGVSTPAAIPGASPGSRSRHSERVSIRASRPSESWKSWSRCSSSASSRSTATVSAPVSSRPVSRPEASRSSASNSGHEAAEDRLRASSSWPPKSASVAGASMPAATPEAPPPGPVRSSTATDRPCWAILQPQAIPITPAPMTTTS